MPYTAQSGGGLFGSSVYPDTRPQVDPARILDAISGGASSLIHAAYLRKMNDANLANTRARLELDQQREQREEGHTKFQEQLERDKFAADQLYKGYHEGEHSEPGVSYEAPTGEMGKPTGGAISRAMQGAPLSMTPPKTATYETKRVTQPAGPHYDVDKSVPYRTGVDRAAVTAQGADERLDKQIAARNAAAALGRATRLELQANGQKFKASTIGRAMTGNVAEQRAQRAAIGLVGLFDGSYDDASDFLASQEGADYREAGVKPHHLSFAVEQYLRGATNQSVSLERGAMGQDPGEAVGAVTATRSLVRGARKPDATPATRAAAPKTAAAPPAAAPAAATPATPAPATAAPAKAPAKAAPTGESQLSDADLWEAKVRAGMPKAEATAYVKNRKKK